MKTTRKLMRILMLGLMIVMIFTALSVCVSAVDGEATEAASVEETTETAETADNSKGTKALSAALVVGLAAATGAVAMGFAIAKSVEGISRQPEAESKIRTALMLGLVFIETAIIYALIIAVLIIFVL
jgi:F-type H+-transporting ATPase subunit c